MRPGIHIARSFYNPTIEPLNLLNLLNILNPWPYLQTWLKYYKYH